MSKNRLVIEQINNASTYLEKALAYKVGFQLLRDEGRHKECDINLLDGLEEDFDELFVDCDPALLSKDFLEKRESSLADVFDLNESNFLNIRKAIEELR